ncbi:MAG TPA: carotenoid 1,2-hydratase [Caldimonas sp.]|jgi:predicted secreted hydrolase|nr:carotenoid 1,2-hydratase [Caldimonas sp.]HEX2541836.1 carotenoid 1,2-hydratase [Caldimonas sp.]
MHPRRAFVLALLASRAPARAATEPALRWPADFGAHPESRIEWWYITGALERPDRAWGFQITFFRAASGIEAATASRFAARQIVFAHAAVTDLAQRRLRHDQRIARSGFGIAEAAVGDTDLVLRDWRLKRSERAGRSRYETAASSESGGFAFELSLDATQPVLLQGRGGISRKGPDPEQTSRYYSEPQLAVQGSVRVDGATAQVAGRAWLDHEWSDSILDARAVGWDWIGMNLDDGGALTAFRLRRADGSTLWSGGSHRPVGGETRDFANGEAAFVPGRTWTSPSSRAVYPVEWRVRTPAGMFRVRSLLDDQELDSRASSGAIYWEGLSVLEDEQGRRVGRGYLEMTGYAARLVL